MKTHPKNTRRGTGNVPSSRRVRAACRAVASFLRSRVGGGMLIGCAFVILGMAGAGSTMSNYAWREAQWEEVRAAVRAAISSAGPLLSGAGDSKINEEIAARVAAFAQAALAGLQVDKNDVTVDHDAATGVTTVDVTGTYMFSDIWGTGNANPGQRVGGETVNVRIEAKLDADRYEVAVALDISRSMTDTIKSGVGNQHVVKLDALKTAMQSVVDAMQSASRTTQGSMLVSLVPYGSAVNAADTGGTGHTPGKEQYVRMLAGTPAAGDTIADTLSTARAAVANGWGHWVDSFHSYGVGDDLGPLRKQALPSALLNNTDWNLRKNVSLDVSAQVPGLGTWDVNGKDFWNGCMMARWGAYWHPDARPAGWAPDPDDWPVTRSVDKWSAGGAALPADTPLHLSDAPPDAGDGHTLFTAYSWPDARIAGNADHRLQTIMATLLEAPRRPELLRGTTYSEFLDERHTFGDNNWTRAHSQRGSALCPPSPITPLTDQLAVVRQAVNGLQPVCAYPDCEAIRLRSSGATYLHLGIVWGLRSLSPLWQRVWNVTDLQGAPRPAVSCAPGESDAACDSRLRKSILIISDGADFAGHVVISRLRGPTSHANPPWDGDYPGAWACKSKGDMRKYHAAAEEDNETDFNSHFGAYLDQGTFGGTQMDAVLDSFRVLDPLADSTARRSLREAVLKNLTPWQLFRGLDAEATDALMDGANETGFRRRPMQMEHFCRPASLFSPYGRIGDYIYAGDSPTQPGTPLPPVADAAPYNLAGKQRHVYLNDDQFGLHRGLMNEMSGFLDDALIGACEIAGKRDVRINAVYIGKPSERAAINALERCTDRAGGTVGVQDVLVTPDAATLKDAFVKLFTIRRNLRFLN